jgi:hypothetical protein
LMDEVARDDSERRITIDHTRVRKSLGEPWTSGLVY